MSSRKNPIVRILIGIPASGKTTWCNQFLARNPDWVRVGRDFYRNMLRNAPVVDFKTEELINAMIEGDLTAALNHRYNVLVDNTNLKAEHIQRIVDHVQVSADIEFQLFDISLDKAIERDKNRDVVVGETAIKRMYKDYKKLIDSYPLVNVKRQPRLFTAPPFDPNLPSIVIFDIDGTLAHMNGKRGPYDWLKVDIDDLDETIARIFKMHKKHGDTIWCLSGRDSAGRQKTEEWLEFYDIVPDRLLMRPKDNTDKDSKIKREFYENEILGKYNVLMIYDDRDQVVKMWRSLGMKVLQVNPGNF